MEVINGWEIQRDGAGFWAVAGTVRLGPYPRKSEAQGLASATPVPVVRMNVAQKRKLSPADAE